jgi:hypothetical protein
MPSQENQKAVQLASDPFGHHLRSHLAPDTSSAIGGPANGDAVGVGQHRPLSAELGSVGRVLGKTVNRRLTPSEAALYNGWIGNDRQVRALIAEMREVAATAQQVMLEETASEAG